MLLILFSDRKEHPVNSHLPCLYYQGYYLVEFVIRCHPLILAGVMLVN